jgi:hypothetical protein
VVISGFLSARLQKLCSDPFQSEDALESEWFEVMTAKLSSLAASSQYYNVPALGHFMMTVQRSLGEVYEETQHHH